jgi:hypothetical protein
LPLLNSPNAQSLAEYWKLSHQLRFVSTAQREAFADITLRPRLDKEEDPFKRRLLTRLIEGSQAKAA